MKQLSFHYLGVASPSKKSALKRLVEANQPDIILLQETLGDATFVSRGLEAMFKWWNFIGVDVRGRSGRLVIG